MELYCDCNYMGFNIWELHRIWKTPTCEQDIGQQGQTEMVRLRKQNQSQELPLIETKQNRFRAISAINRAEFPDFSKLTERLPLVGLNACCPLLAKVSICELNVQNFNENTPQVLIFFPMV